MVLIAVKGGLGAGKTVFMVREGYHYQQKGYQVYTNFKVDYPHVLLKNPKQLIYIGLNNPKPKVVLIDEAYLWFDALIKSSKIQTFYRNLINVTRKFKFIMYFTTQTLGQMNYRTRLLFDYVIEPVIIRPIFRYKNSDENKKFYDKKLKEFMLKNPIKMRIHIFIPNTIGGFALGNTVTIPNIEKYFKYYDTNEIINDFITNFELEEEPKLINGQTTLGSV